MRVTITGRHLELTDALKTHIEGKLGKFDRLSVKIPEAHVMLDVEKYRHKAEIILHVNHSILTSKEESDDMYVSVDGAMDKMERMLRRYRTKYSRKHQKTSPETLIQTGTPEEEEEF